VPDAKENSDASTKKKKKKKKKKSIYQTGARDGIELAVRCERLLHVEGKGCHHSLT
jgi:hypothetical protein